MSEAPAPLPVPQLKSVGSGISLLLPLSRRGHGPGLIVLVPDVEASTSINNLSIEDGVPSSLMKWAEEGYTVVEIRKEAWSQGKEPLSIAVAELSKCEKCQPKEAIGLVSYDPELWNLAAPTLTTIPEIVGAVIYSDASTKETLASSSVPVLQHLAGTLDTKAPRSDELTVYPYAGMSSYLFASPFQKSFHYANEAVSHTRNLTFLKRRMNGPYFDLEAIWDEHTYFEFENRSVEHTMSTMVQEPYVNHIPTMTGGIGRDRLSNFYRHHFIWNNPEDTELELISRTVGVDRVVDEFIYKFTHTMVIDWLLPGIPPTGRKVEIPFTAVVNVRGDRLYHEHIAWDQSTALIQVGLLPEYLPYPYPLPDGKTPAPGKRFEYRVPAAGNDTSNKMRDKNSVESNGMFEFKIREVHI